MVINWQFPDTFLIDFTIKSAQSNSFFSQFMQKVPESLAQWFVIIALLLLFFLLILLIRRIRRGRPIIIVCGETGEKTDVERLYQTVAQKVYQFNYMLQILPPIRLEAELGIDIKKVLQNPDSERESLSLKLGPVEIGKLEHLIDRLLRRDIYNLRIIKNSNKYTLSIESSTGVIFHTKIDNLDQDLEEAVINALAIASTSVGSDMTMKQQLIRGLLTMSQFFNSPFRIKHLLNARDIFDKATNWASVQYIAKFLALCATQFAQDRPGETRNRAVQLWQGAKKRNKDVISYQQALAEFYTYSPEGYLNANNLLQAIKEPGFITKICARFLLRRLKRKLLLYLLSKAHLAIVIAHWDPNKGEEIEKIKYTIQQKMKNFFYSHLGRTLDEVRWRLLNAEVALACNRKESNKDVISLAHLALMIAPYALSVQANLGRLLMLEAKKADASHDMLKRRENLEKAKQIFIELEKTGWDPGYVNYRLAQIFRVKGDFDSAKKHLNVASDPIKRDVPEEKLTEEHNLIHQRSRIFN